MPKEKVKKGVKYCPKCGSTLKEADKFCIKCGYSFEKRKKKLNLKALIIAIVIIIIAWILIRLIAKQPIIPNPFGALFGNKTAG